MRGSAFYAPGTSQQPRATPSNRMARPGRFVVTRLQSTVQPPPARRTTQPYAVVAAFSVPNRAAWEKSHARNALPRENARAAVATYADGGAGGAKWGRERA